MANPYCPTGWPCRRSSQPTVDDACPSQEAVHVPGPSPRGAPQLGQSLAVSAALPVQQQQRQKLEYQEPLVCGALKAYGPRLPSGR